MTKKLHIRKVQLKMYFSNTKLSILHQLISQLSGRRILEGRDGRIKNGMFIREINVRI